MTYYPSGMVYYNNHPSPAVFPPSEHRRTIDLTPSNASSISDLGNGFWLYQWGKQVLNPNDYSSVFLNPYSGQKVVSAGYETESSGTPITILSNSPLSASIWRFWLVSTRSANVGFSLISKI